MTYLISKQRRLLLSNASQDDFIYIQTNSGITVNETLSWMQTEVISTTYNALSRTDGQRNTDVVNAYEIANNASRSAAEYVIGATSVRWFLPSVEQLRLLVANKNVLSQPLIGSRYWSSTEDPLNPDTKAYAVNSTGDVDSRIKTESYPVRPIALVPYSTLIPPYAAGEDIGYGTIYYVDERERILYIAANEDLSSIQFGSGLGSAQASFASAIKVVVDPNMEAIERVGDIIVSVSGGPTLTFQVIQDAEDPSSQEVLISDIVDNIMVRSLDDQDYLFGVNRYAVTLEAKRLMQDISFKAVNEIRAYQATITPSNVVIPPHDFVDYIRLSLVDKRGRLLPIFVNNKLNLAFTYIRDNESQLITDNEGYPIKAKGARREIGNGLIVYDFYDSVRDVSDPYSIRSLPGITGGQESYTGAYRYDSDAREFILDNLPADFDQVVIEYVSDPILAEKDVDRLKIHKYFQEPMESGIYYRLIRSKRDVPQSEKQRARKDFYNDLRLSKRLKRAKPAELVQRLNSDIGFNKMI